MKPERQRLSTPAPSGDKSRGQLYRWDSPDNTRCVIVSSSLIEDIRRQAIRALLALPKRGAEVGGLLFGHIRPNPSSGTQIQVDAFEEVSCEHRFGPSYKLSETDQRTLDDLLARHHHAGSPPIIGFYRSYTGKPPAVDEGDRELIVSRFPHRHFVSLLLQPISAQKCAAGFRFWSEGELCPEPAYAPFLFDAAELKPVVPGGGADPEPPARSPAAALPEAAPAATQPVAITPAATPPPSPPAGMTPPEIPLTVTQPAAPWPPANGSSANGSSATGLGALESAVDPLPKVPGVRPETAPALPPRLAAPRRAPREADETLSAAPRPRTWLLPLVLCFLVALISAASYSVWKIAREPRWVQLRLDARPSPRLWQVSWDHSAPAVAEALRGVLQVIDGPAQKDLALTADQVRSGRFDYSPAHDLKSGDSMLFRLLVYGPDGGVTGDGLRIAGLRLPEAAPAAKPALEPPSPAAAAPPVPAVPPAPAATRTDTDAAATVPTVRREVQPAIPPGIRSRIRARIIVAVEVQVDESGRVTQASSKLSGNGLDRYLAEQAIKAARQWTFSPARSRTGRPVAAAKTIQFVFTPAR